MINHSFRTPGQLIIKLLGPFLVIILIALASALITITISYNTQIGYAEHLQQIAGNQKATQINNFIQNLQDELREQVSFFGQDWDSKDNYFQILQSIKQDIPSLQKLTYIESNGQQFEKVTGDKTVSVTQLEIENQMQSLEFVQALKGEEYIGPVYISELGSQAFTFSFPVFSNETQIIGVLLAEVSLDQVWEIVDNQKLFR